MHPGVPGRIWTGQVGSKSENIQKKIRFLKILERKFPIFSKKNDFFIHNGSFGSHFRVWYIESKNVKKRVGFKRYFEEFVQRIVPFWKKKMIFLIKKCFFYKIWELWELLWTYDALLEEHFDDKKAKFASNHGA